MSTRKARIAVVALMIASAAVHATTFALAEGRMSRFMLELAAAGWAPHVIVGTVALLSRWTVWLLPSMAFMWLADVAAFLSVFVWPTDAQAPLILLFMPMWNMLIVLPASLLLTAAVRWVWRRRTSR